jgi:hypothetical protein
MKNWLIPIRFYWYKITRQRKCAVHATALVKARFTMVDLWYCERCDDDEHEADKCSPKDGAQ